MLDADIEPPERPAHRHQREPNIEVPADHMHGDRVMMKAGAVVRKGKREIIGDVIDRDGRRLRRTERLPTRHPKQRQIDDV